MVTEMPVNRWQKDAVKARRLALLRAIGEFWRLHGYAPSNRDLTVATDITAKAVVRYNLSRLAAAGLVAFDEGVPRSVRLTSAGWEAAEMTAPCVHEGDE